MGLVVADVCPVEHVRLVHRALVLVHGLERTPRQAAGGGACGSQRGDVIEDDILGVVVVEQQVVRALAHVEASAFRGEVGLALGRAVAVDASTDTRRYAGT